MIKPTFYCNVCGAERKQTNRWWTAWTSQGSLILRPHQEGDVSDDMTHLCGEVCAHKYLGQFMEEAQNRPAVAQQPERGDSSA